jgi:mycofactocin system glycosyltransferase
VATLTAEILIPAGWSVRPDPRVLRPTRTILVGGAPRRLFRLTPAGAALVDRVFAGEPVPAGSAAQRLVKRLLDSGIVHPVPVSCDSPPDVTVVVPVKDRPDGLAATLEALAPCAPVLVVDDGSGDAAAIGRVAARHGAGLIRLETNRGPAAARDAGWRRASTDLVAFVDAECRPVAGWLSALAPYFDDPGVGAVAPRVSPRGPGGTPKRRLHAYEATRSPLDMGDRPALVGPASRVRYVPTAVLVVRRSALEAIGGFDTDLRVGEDVDLVWRLTGAGWRVRYVPEVVADHPSRPDLRRWLAQRFSYGRSSALLAARHGKAVAPLEVAPWATSVWIALGWRRLPVVAALAAASVVRLRIKTSGSGTDEPLPWGATLQLAAEGQLAAGRSLAGALTRAWWPLAAAAALVHPPSRRPLLAAALLPPLTRWMRDRPPLGILSWSALHLADDLAYGAGVWAGVVGERSLTALAPAVRGLR